MQNAYVPGLCIDTEHRFWNWAQISMTLLLPIMDQELTTNIVVFGSCRMLLNSTINRCCLIKYPLWKKAFNSHIRTCVLELYVLLQQFMVNWRKNRSYCQTTSAIHFNHSLTPGWAESPPPSLSPPSPELLRRVRDLRGVVWGWCGRGGESAAKRGIQPKQPNSIHTRVLKWMF